MAVELPPIAKAARALLLAVEQAAKAAATRKTNRGKRA